MLESIWVGKYEINTMICLGKNNNVNKEKNVYCQMLKVRMSKPQKIKT